MKKTLLLSLTLISGLGMIAQNGRTGKPKLHTMKTSQMRDLAVSELAPRSNNVIPSVSNTSKVQIPYNVISNSANAYYAINGQETSVSYNADVNTISVIHRKSQFWTGFPDASSGSIQSTFSSNAGASWDSTIIFAQAATVGLGRYPGGAIWNPTGNTNPANARAFCTGPALINGGFAGNFYGSGPLTPAAVTASDNDVYTYMGNTNSSLDSLGFAYQSQCEAGGFAWATGDYDGDPTGATYDVLQFKGNGLMKGTYNTGTSGFDWSLIKARPAFFINANGGSPYPYAINTGRTAFSPNGMIGYTAMTGVVAGATGSARSYTPIVFKTTDGGTTWNQVLANYQWQTNNPELEQCVVAQVNPAATAGLAMPWFSDANGTDVVVDNNGILHYITTIEAAYSDHADSLAYTYTGYYDYNVSHPFIIDFMTDGTPGMGWKTQLIDSIMSAPVLNTDAANPWGQGGAGLGYDNRIQASRNTTGDVIMVTWADSDPAQTGNTFNGAPDIYMVGYKPSTNMISNKMLVTFGFQDLYWHYTSDKARTVSPGVYNVPMTYLKSTNGSNDPVTAVQIAYVDDANITDAQINVPAPVMCALASINTNNTAIASVGQNFPNPFSKSTTINVTLNQNEDITLTVFNTVGQLVVSKNVKGVVGVNTLEVDAANLTNGIYFYTVKAGDNKVSKKMMIQK